MTRLDESRVLECRTCGKTVLRRSATQVYCPPCSAERSDVRKKDWSVANRPALRERTEARRARGVEASDESRRGALWASEEIEPRQRLVRVAVPFDWKFSKNAIWSQGRGGHVYIRQEVKTVRDGLITRLKESGGPWFEGKVWIDILVQKPNQRGDAINVVDLVCDAVKVAIGVDDRWFSIARLDWEIVKKDPLIFIGVSQAVTEHHRACSSCGAVKPLGEFGKSSRDKLGHARECRECSRFLDRERRDRRKARRGAA